jgi:hypothetical protein
VDGPDVVLSAIDEERFGIRAARASGVTEAMLPAVLDFCAAHRVGLLIARCAVADVRAAQAMERRGCSLMDTLVYYACDLRRVAIPPRDAVIAVRAVRSGDEPAVAVVAAEAFRGFHKWFDVYG